MFHWTLVISINPISFIGKGHVSQSQSNNNIVIRIQKDFICISIKCIINSWRLFGINSNLSTAPFPPTWMKNLINELKHNKTVMQIHYAKVYSKSK